jgi:hypothetical protein
MKRNFAAAALIKCFVCLRVACDMRCTLAGLHSDNNNGEKSLMRNYKKLCFRTAEAEQQTMHSSECGGRKLF